MTALQHTAFQSCRAHQKQRTFTTPRHDGTTTNRHAPSFFACRSVACCIRGRRSGRLFGGNWRWCALAGEYMRDFRLTVVIACVCVRVSRCVGEKVRNVRKTPTPSERSVIVVVVAKSGFSKNRRGVRAVSLSTSVATVGRSVASSFAVSGSAQRQRYMNATPHATRTYHTKCCACACVCCNAWAYVLVSVTLNASRIHWIEACLRIETCSTMLWIHNTRHTQRETRTKSINIHLHNSTIQTTFWSCGLVCGRLACSDRR